MTDLSTQAVSKALNGFLQKSDGRDKLTATVQYVCMFLSAGQPGMTKDIQMKVAAARKVFRILRPLETITPLINDPCLPGKQHPVLEILPKLKTLLMALYFAGDHVVWAGSVNLISDKTVVDRAQKTSLWSWFLGSVCTIVTESVTHADAIAVRSEKETDAEWARRWAESRAATRKRSLVLLHAVLQALLAMGLLQLRPWKPRTVGAFGVLASALNCYMLFPALPKAAYKLTAAPTLPAEKANIKEL